MARRMWGLQIQRAILWYVFLYPTLMVCVGRGSLLARLAGTGMENGEVEARKTRAAVHREEEGPR